MTWVFLSHPLDETTPTFYTNPRFTRKPQARVDTDGYAQETVTFLNHSGSHADAQAHFIQGGRAIDQYRAEEFVFASVTVAEVASQPDDLIERLVVEGRPELLLLKTGFQRLRGDPECWGYHNPGLTGDLARHLLDACPGVRALGMDLPSAAGAQHLAEGAAFHQVWLGADRLIFEDLDLNGVDAHSAIRQVLALPLRICGSDGAPCTVIAQVEA